MPTRLTSVGVGENDKKSQSVAKSNYFAQVVDLFVNESKGARLQI